MNDKIVLFGLSVAAGSVAAIAEDASNHFVPTQYKSLSESFIGRGLIGAVAMTVGTIVVNYTVRLTADIIETVKSVEVPILAEEIE